MAKQWRSAVVGVGVVGGWHCKVLTQMAKEASPIVTLAAVCDTNPPAGQKRLAELGLSHVPLYTNLPEMLEKEQIDVVHVSTPSGDHMGPAITAMEAGKNVIVEKPMEIQLDRIDKMYEVSKKNKVRLAGIFQNRWNKANAALKKAVDEKRFGRTSFIGCFTPWYRPDQYYRDGGWRGTWKLDGGGAIMNQSVHQIDLLQWIGGPVKTVSAFAGSRIHPEIEVEDTLACALQFENGTYGIIMGTTGMWPGSPVRFEIGGENGTAVSDGSLQVFKFRDERPEDETLRQELAPGKSASGGAGANTDAVLEFHVENIRSILQCWDRGEDAPTSAPEARKAVAIILAMYESARKGGAPVEVK